MNRFPRHRRHGLQAGLGASALAVLLTACSLSTHTPGPRPGGADARAGGTLTVGITQPGSIDPANAYEPMGSLVASTICEPLVQLDPVTGNLAPGGLVESIVYSGHGTSFSMKLRSGVRFQDGSKLTAADVLAELDRVASHDNASFVANVISHVAGFPQVHGDVNTETAALRKHLRGVGTFSSNSVEVVSDGTSNAEMIRAFTHLLSSPVPRKVAARDPDAFARKPVCAGPYQLERPFQPGDTEIRVKRFAGYYGKDNTYTAGGAGYADEIVFKIFPDQAAEVAAWQAGQLDIAHVPTTELAAVPAQPALAADLVSAPNGSVVYAGTSDGRGQAFANAAFRVALSKAVDRQALNVSIYAGGDLPATGFVPPTVGDDQFRANACGDNVPARPDVAGARRAYAAGPGQAAPLTFSVNDDFANRKEAEALSQQWRAALGVNATVVPMQWDEYLATAQGTPGFDGLFLESWRPPYTSIDGYLYQPFDTNGVGQDNWARFTDAGFDEELEHGAREAGGNAPGRYLAYARLEGTLCDRMPMIPLLFRQNHFLVRKARVGSALGTLLERSTGQPMLRELFVRGL